MWKHAFIVIFTGVFSLLGFKIQDKFVRKETVEFKQHVRDIIEEEREFLRNSKSENESNKKD